MSAPWVDIAATFVGERETAGPNDSPFIRRMLASLQANWLLGQPWCGVFTAMCMQRAGLTYPKDYYRARAWEQWGSALARPCYGCVVVFTRTGGGHVGFVIGERADGMLMVLGGNQGDAVNVRAFDRARVTGYRWPLGRPLPEQFALPVVDGQKSTGEA